MTITEQKNIGKIGLKCLNCGKSWEKETDTKNIECPECGFVQDKEKSIKFRKDDWL